MCHHSSRLPANHPTHGQLADNGYDRRAADRNSRLSPPAFSLRHAIARYDRKAPEDPRFLGLSFFSQNFWLITIMCGKFLDWPLIDLRDLVKNDGKKKKAQHANIEDGRWFPDFKETGCAR